jgi:PKD repeat protein
LDDDFDTDNGYSGFVQFGLSVRDPQIADDPAVSTSEGFESDNDPTGSTANPQTRALFSNMTLIGPYRGNTASTIASGYRRGARIRRNSALKIFNSVFMDHVRGLHIDGIASEGNATNNVLKFKHNIVAGNTNGLVCEVNSGSTFDIRTWFGASHNDSLTSSANILTTPYNFTAPDYRPAAASVALTGADFFDPAFGGLIAATQAPEGDFTYAQDTANGSRSIMFTNTTNGKGQPVEYAWDFGVDGITTDTSSAVNPTFAYTENGMYAVKMIVFSPVGNDTVIQMVRVFATGLNDVKTFASQVTVYPNPANDRAQVEFVLNKSAKVEVNIVDITGRLVKSIEATNMSAGANTVSVETNDLNTGLYFVQLVSDSGSKTTRLMIAR